MKGFLLFGKDNSLELLYQDLPEQTRRKLRIFFVLNLCGFTAGIFIPVAGLINNDGLSWLSWVVAVSPALISGLTLWLLRKGKAKSSFVVYFLFYPALSILIYLERADLGIELLFILYGVMSVFLLQKQRNVFLVCLYCLIGYLTTRVVAQSEEEALRLLHINPIFYFINQLFTGILIFFTLLLIKNESVGYEKILLQQKESLEKLNQLKNKLFSIVSHDLRNPIHALKNYFVMAQQYNISGEDLKAIVPEVVNDLQYTTELLENLLAWSKSQMNNTPNEPIEVNIERTTLQVIHLLKRQAENKKIKLNTTIQDSLTAIADPEAINLVLRNLVSNAIKFSPECAAIEIGARTENNMVAVYVRDQGRGMDEQTISSILKENYFSTEGTSKEQGTGLGLMICRDYLKRNNGFMKIESKPGSGSCFTFYVPAIAV